MITLKPLTTTLHNRIDLITIPFTERGSRLMLLRNGNHLAIRLAERWERYNGSLSAYRARPPIVRNFFFSDENGDPLSFTIETYAHSVEMTTKSGRFDWAFADTETLAVCLPNGQYRLEFAVYAQRATTDRRGGVLRGVRNIVYTTNARLVKNVITALGEDWFKVQITIDAQAHNILLLNVTPRWGFNRAIPDTVIESARLRWNTWIEAVPPVLDTYTAQYTYAWWVMNQGLLNTRYYFTREALSPSKLHYVGVWLWDQSFHAIAYRHINMKLAEDQLRIMLDHQQADGMLPDAVHDEGAVTHITRPIEGTVTKPPIVAWSALKLFEKYGNRDFLEEIYEPLQRWQDWWLRDNLNECGLCEYKHPFSSGLDDSPLWDCGMPVVAADLNTYLYIQMESLSRIASVIELPQDAEQYQAQAVKWLQTLIDVLWNEELGIFDSLHNGQRIPVLTPFSLLPLWTGKLPAAMNERLIAHLTDPAEFWTDHPIPTVALNDPTFDANQMWRGPLWPNINYLFVEALTRVGRDDLAGELRRKTLRTLAAQPDIYEYYNPLTGEKPPKAASVFGWSSAVFIDLALQETLSAFSKRK